MVDALSAAVRALSFIALFQAAGIATFVAIFGRHLRTTLESTRRIGLVSAIIAAVLVAIHFALEPARMGGELAALLDPMLQGLVLHSSIATAAALRIAGLVLIVVGLRSSHASAELVGSTDGPVAESSSYRAGAAQIACGVTLALFSFIFVGHTATESPRAALQALLILHLIVVTFWFGALIPLYRASAGESNATAAAVTEAFSTIAVRVVPLLLIAGVALAALLLPSLDALWTTTYGQLLLAKSCAFAVLMLLGALNKWRLGPALAHGDVAAASIFRRSLALEYALIAAALSVTAVLTSFYSPH